MPFKCGSCREDLPEIPDGNLRWCSCQGSGIDHTPHYTRLLGNVVDMTPDWPGWSREMSVLRWIHSDFSLLTIMEARKELNKPDVWLETFEPLQSHYEDEYLKWPEDFRHFLIRKYFPGEKNVERLDKRVSEHCLVLQRLRHLLENDLTEANKLLDEWIPALRSNPAEQHPNNYWVHKWLTECGSKRLLDLIARMDQVNARRFSRYFRIQAEMNRVRKKK